MRDQNWDQRLNSRLYDGLNSVIFCTSEVILFEKKEPKSASRRLNKLKKRVLKNFLDEILNYRNAGLGPKNLNFTGTRKSWSRTYLVRSDRGAKCNRTDINITIRLYRSAKYLNPKILQTSIYQHSKVI